MSVSTQHLNVEELEFFAENELIEIKPKAQFPEVLRNQKISLFSGEYGPFDSYSQIKVPLWLAIMFYKKNLCQIVVPEWLTKSKLEEFLENEQNPDNQTHADLPFYYREIASILFENQVIEDPEVYSLFDHIEKLRKSSIENYIKTTIDDHKDSIKEDNPISSCFSLQNYSGSECIEFSSTFLSYMNMIKDIDMAENESDMEESEEN